MLISTKVQFNNEIFDTDNIYDNSSNYRITIPSGKAGKYYIETNIFVDAAAVSNLSRAAVYIYKNNVLTVQSFVDFRTAGYSQKMQYTSISNNGFSSWRLYRNICIL